MVSSFSLEELSARINAWCEEHDIVPASGQAGEAVSERNVRYYRTLGLVDAPADEGYGEKHFLQLAAVRLLQAQGLPLRRIRELLYGRTIEELKEVQRRGIREIRHTAGAMRIAPVVGDELWRTIPLDEDFFLISRRGTPLTAGQRDAVLRALQATVRTTPPHR